MHRHIQVFFISNTIFIYLFIHYDINDIMHNFIVAIIKYYIRQYGTLNTVKPGDRSYQFPPRLILNCLTLLLKI